MDHSEQTIDDRLLRSRGARLFRGDESGLKMAAR
jgi:hypothetical protein